MAVFTALSRGLVVFSVDLELPMDQLRVEQGRALDGTTQRLIDLFRQFDIPATWAVADPVHSAATERILAASENHELAVRGDSTWVGSKAGRARFARELSRRVLRARAAGLSATTLIPGEAALDDHLDLIVKHGITAVRGMIDHAGTARETAQPHALHFGLWEIPGSLSLPGESRWFAGGGRRLRVRRGIDRAITAKKLFQVVINAPRLSANPKAIRVVERTLHYARKMRDEQFLDVATLADVAARLSNTKPSSPTRSILRASA